MRGRSIQNAVVFLHLGSDSIKKYSLVIKYKLFSLVNKNKENIYLQAPEVLQKNKQYSPNSNFFVSHATTLKYTNYTDILEAA